MTEWPKIIEPLSPKLAKKAFAWEAYWLGHYQNKFSFIERFNRAFLQQFRSKGRIIEIGPGTNSRISQLFQDADYYCLDKRSDFCQRIRSKIPADHIIEGDIQGPTSLPDNYFDVVIAVHLFEHLANLPAALQKIRRILIPTGSLLAVVPCIESPAYNLAASLTAGRIFRREFGKGYKAMRKHEHINTAREIFRELNREFRIERIVLYPFNIDKYFRLNLLAAFQCRPKYA